VAPSLNGRFESVNGRYDTGVSPATPCISPVPSPPGIVYFLQTVTSACQYRSAGRGAAIRPTRKSSQANVSTLGLSTVEHQGTVLFTLGRGVVAEFRPRANVFRPALDFVFGYDFFISHSHGDGNDYPKRLQERLQQVGFKVFLDLSGYAPGMDLPRETIRQVKKSRRLLVVARRAALASEWVKREVEVALSQGHIPVIININSAIENSAASFIAKTAVERQWLTLNETLDNPDSGPSDEAIASLVRGFKNTRQETKRLRVLAGATAILAITTVIAVWQGYAALENAKRANDRERTAVTERNVAVANESRVLSALSQAASLRGRYADAVMFAVAAWPRIGDQERPFLQQTIDALSVALPRLRERARLLETKAVKNAKFFMGGDVLVIQPYRGPLEVWNTKTLTEVQSLGSGTDVFDSIDANGSGVLVSARMKDYSVRTYDLSSGDLLTPANIQSKDIKKAKLSSAGSSSSSPSLSPPDECASSGGSGKFTSPDGSHFLLTCSGKGVIFDSKSPNALAKISGPSIAADAAFSPDNRLLATVGWNAFGELWNGATGEKIADLSGHTDGILSVDISAKNDIVTTSASADRTVRLWDGSLAKWSTLGRFGNQVNKETALTGNPAVSNDGRELLFIGSGHIQAISLDDLKKHDLITEGTIDFARFCQDRQTVLALEYSGDVVVISNPGSRTIARAKTKASAASCSPKGDVIAVGDRQGSVRLFSTKAGDLLQVLGQVNESKVADVTFSPDGAYVAAAAGKTVRIWKADTTAELVSSIDGGSNIEAIGYAPNGTEIAMAGDISTATKIYDPKSGRLNGSLGDAGEIHRTALFSGDGQRVITSRGKTAVIWDEATGAAIASYGSHESDVIWSSFVKDGKSIVTVSLDGEARLWDGITSEGGDAFQVACKRLLDTRALDQVALAAGLSNLKPICATGHEPIPFKRESLSR
jgi:WD40 repeat protein